MTDIKARLRDAAALGSAGAQLLRDALSAIEALEASRDRHGGLATSPPLPPRKETDR